MVDKNTVEESIENQITNLPQKTDDELWAVVKEPKGVQRQLLATE